MIRVLALAAGIFAMPKASAHNGIPLVIPVPDSLQNTLSFCARLNVLTYCPPSILVEPFTWPASVSKPLWKPENDKMLKSLRETEFIDEGGIWMLLAYQPETNTIVLDHRGSYTTQNWMQDAHFVLGKFGAPFTDNVLAHKGFVDAVKASLGAVEKRIGIMLQKYPDAKLLFTGFSSGALLSPLTAFMACSHGGFLSNYISKITIVTFAGTKIGNQPFVDAFTALNLKLYRVVNSQDAIPLLPPAVLGFKSLGGEVYVNTSDDELPIFCDEQPPAGIERIQKTKGGCLNRNGYFDNVLLDISYVGYHHTHYLGFEMNSCLKLDTFLPPPLPAPRPIRYA